MAASTLPTKILKTRVITKLGSLTALTDYFQFGLGDTTQTYRGNLTVQGSGGAITGPTWVLEGSLDQGVSWFVVPANTTQPIVLTGQFSGDTAALFANQYNVSGLAGGLFKFGASAGTAITSIDVYALVG